MAQATEKPGFQKQEKIRSKFRIFTFLAHYSYYFKWFLIGVVLVIFFIGYFFVIGPKRQLIQQRAGAKSEVRRAEYAELVKYFSDLKEYKLDYDKISQADKEKLSVMLPEQDSFAQEELFSQIEAIVQSRGLLLTSITIDSVDKNNSKKSAAGVALPSVVGQIKVNMNIVGADYKGLKSLLSSLENNLRLIDIQTVNFSPAEQTASLQAFVYYLKK